MLTVNTVDERCDCVVESSLALTVNTVDECCDCVAESSDPAVTPWMGAVTATVGGCE